MQHQAWCHQLLPPHAILTQLGQLWLRLVCSASSKAIPEAGCLTFMMSDVLNVIYSRLESNPLIFLFPLGKEHMGIARVGKSLELLHTDVKISQQ